jgi:hypothetical protein
MTAKGRGFCAMVVNSSGEKIIDKVYDTHSIGLGEKFVKMLEGLSDGDSLLLSAYDEASFKLSNKAKDLLKAMGADQIHDISWRNGYIFGGIKGRSDGQDDLVGDGPNDIVDEKYYFDINNGSTTVTLNGVFTL